MPPAAAAKKTPAPTTTPKGRAAASAQAAEESEATPKSRKAVLTAEQIQAKCHEYIDALYTADGTTEEGATQKRNLRSRLRNLDRDWRKTYADYITENYAQEEEPQEEAPAPAPVPKKKVSKKA